MKYVGAELLPIDLMYLFFYVILEKALTDYYIIVCLGDHCIREGVIVMSNTYSVHMDETYWDQPHLFQPDRFLDHEVNNNHDDILKHGSTDLSHYCANSIHN